MNLNDLKSERLSEPDKVLLDCLDRLLESNDCKRHNNDQFFQNDDVNESNNRQEPSDDLSENE